MPSVQSLQRQQYYANPRNSFWWIMAQLFGFSDELSYAQKCNALIEAGVAVWDVLRDCDRPGSADSDIVRESEQPNDFINFFQRYPSLKLIGFNGRAAQAIFMRHCAEQLDSKHAPKMILLPSTSPAYAAMSREQKLDKWRELIR